MIEQWQLQSFMADALRYHHESVTRIADALPLVKIVFVANLLTMEPRDEGVAFDAAHTLFELSRSEVEQLLADNDAQVEETARSLGIKVQVSESDETGSESHDQEEIALLRSVRDVSLLQGTLQNLLEAYGQETILGIIRQGLQVLFDIDNVLFLIRDPETSLLQGREGSEAVTDGRVRELTLSLDSPNCLPVHCLERRQPLDSSGRFEPVDLSIIDDQLIRLIGKNEMLCLPLIAHGEALGVMVVGMNDIESFKRRGQMNLLTMFVNQAALAVYADAVRSRQASLVQAERLEAASALAKKVAHEVNNPLGIIKNYIKIFGMKLPEDDPVHDQLRIINEELDRVARIVQRLSDFSEPPVRQTEPVNVNAVLTDLVKILRESVQTDSRVNIHLDLAPSLPVIYSEKNSLKQVFINLIKNAVESMPTGGDLYIATEACENLARDTDGGKKGECNTIRITFRDNGPGIPENVKSRLFEPFVTSKKGGHAGLGLSVVYNIVKELRGTVTCKSEPPSGTQFDIVLPVE
jgi:signal transduction histidine kinase